MEIDMAEYKRRGDSYHWSSGNSPRGIYESRKRSPLGRLYDHARFAWGNSHSQIVYAAIAIPASGLAIIGALLFILLRP